MVKSSYSYEEVYAAKIMAFEKDMVKQNRRPPLPSMHKYVNTAPAATALRQQQLETRQNVFRDVLDNISEGEAVDARTLARRLGTTSQSLTNYMKPMVEEGYLTKLNMPNSKGVVVYVYMITGKELVDDSEQGDFGGY